MNDSEMPINEAPITVAAMGDLHCDRHRSAPVAELLKATAEEADVILLAGDLTNHGEEEEARILAGHLGELTIPVVAVLGNHDCHSGHSHEVAEALRDGGVTVLERGHAVIHVNGIELGIAGSKGFVGGFAGSHLPDFGEPLLRALYAETGAEVAALEDGLREIATCLFRLVLLHYSPSEGTLQGEPPGIFTLLGSDRLAAPIREHEPTAVFHGHAHLGSTHAAIGEVPLFNVSLPVRQGRAFIYKLDPEAATPGTVH